mgnify:CR=1 FL=1
MTISNEIISNVEAGDGNALADLDARGLLVAPGEDGPTFAARLRTLRQNLAELERALGTGEGVDVGGVQLDAASRIPREFFDEAAGRTDSLFGIRVDWVPGFFVNPRFSWLFGGCAFYEYPNFLALFIIRRSFRNRRKWWIYHREELLAHELCHVARVALHSRVFEEHFAYRTSRSRFRRLVGPVVRRPAESFALLGCCFLLLAAQIAQVEMVPALPVTPFWLLVAGVMAFLGARLRRERVVLERAKANLAPLFPGQAERVVFRLSDAEIGTLAACRGKADVEAALPDDLRMRVLRIRFGGEKME